MHTNNVSLYLVHGFLGLPRDWDSFFSKMATHKVDLFAKTLPFWEWAEQFNQEVEKDPNPVKVLVGYSLGGRMALHALIKNPSLWSGGVIISAHLGLNDRQSKQARLVRDNQWAVRFESDRWENLMQDWNQQPVFLQEKQIFERQESDFDRCVLADVLRQWSLGEQDSLSEQVGALAVPILWIAGAEDRDYAAQAERVKLNHPLSKKWIAPLAGHRVPWLQPEIFQVKVTNFLNSLGAYANNNVSLGTH